jgi:predicted DNA-binding protein (UPF0251 family)
MPRPHKPRSIEYNHIPSCFQPVEIPAPGLPQVEITLDEIEAIRLSDLERMNQEDAAARMQVSRQTFGRILTSAREKTAEALLSGKVLVIQGGSGHYLHPGGPHRHRRRGGGGRRGGHVGPNRGHGPPGDYEPR